MNISTNIINKLSPCLLSCPPPRSRTAGDFNATASLIDIFVTLLGILTAYDAPLSASKLHATPTQLLVQRSNNNSARTPAAASRKSDDSFLSSKPAPLSVTPFKL